MSRDTKVKWCMIATMVAADVTMVVALGLQFPLSDLVRPLGFTILLGSVGYYYYCRKEPAFVLCCLTLAHLVLFSSSYTILMYSGATFNLPLIDDQLVVIDKFLGFHLPDFVAWSQAHPQTQRILQFAYDTLLPQTALVVMILGMCGQRKPLEKFMMRFMISAIITWLIFAFFPAEGPFMAYDYEPNQDQARYLAHFNELRSGQRTLVTYRDAEGLITFPSFHTTWSLLLTLAFWKRRTLLLLATILNGAVIISTMTTGWHYLGDVLAGVIVAILALIFTCLAHKWFYPPSLQTDSDTASADRTSLPKTKTI